jgi:hypothetical protein
VQQAVCATSCLCDKLQQVGRAGDQRHCGAHIGPKQLGTLLINNAQPQGELEIGDTVVPMYVDQSRDSLDPNKTVSSLALDPAVLALIHACLKRTTCPGKCFETGYPESDLKLGTQKVI